MTHVLPARRLVQVYVVAGVAAGLAVAMWILQKEVADCYQSCISPPPPPARVRVEVRYNPDSNKDEWQYVSYPRPPGPSMAARVAPVLADVILFLLAGAAAGLFWGLAHVKVRELLPDPFGKENQLDYEEPSSRTLPPGST